MDYKEIAARRLDELKAIRAQDEQAALDKLSMQASDRDSYVDPGLVAPPAPPEDRRIADATNVTMGSTPADVLDRMSASDVQLHGPLNSAGEDLATRPKNIFINGDPTTAPGTRMVPAYNSAGEQIGMKPEAPTFVNRLAGDPSPPPGSVPLAPGTIGPPAPPGMEAGGPITTTTGPQPGMSSPLGAGAAHRLTDADIYAKYGIPDPEQHAREKAAAIATHGEYTKAGDIQAGFSGRIERLMKDTGNEQLAYRDQVQRAYDVRKEREEKAIAGMDKLSEDARNMKIDPSRAFSDMSGAQKFSAALALAFGGALQGLKGGENPGMVALNKVIDNDINAQRTAIAQANGRVEDARGIYSMLRERGLSDEAAKAGAYRILMDSAKTRVGALGAGAQTAAGKSAVSIANKEFEGRQIKEDDELQRLLARGRFLEDHPGAVGGADGGQNKGVSEELRNFANHMQEAGVPLSQTMIDTALESMPETGDIPGVGRGINLAGKVFGEDILNFALSDQGTVNRSNVKKLSLGFQQMITGKGASDKERETINDAFLAAKDKDGVRNAVKFASDAVERLRYNQLTALSDPARVQLQSNEAREKAAGTTRQRVTTGGPPR